VDAIITDSECSAKDIRALTGYQASKIHVVPLAAPQTRATASLASKVEMEYELPKKFILYVGDINWNKNVVGLIEAFAELNDKNYHLILVGKAFKSDQTTLELQAIRSAIQDSGCHDRIKLLGFVPSHHLPAIYRLATLYVQPSWYEGFGFPLLEAMAQGTPVLASKEGSLPEVGGDAAFYFDPYKKGSLVSQLKQLLSDKKLRESKIEEGKLKVTQFSWAAVAQKTRDIYAKYIR
jgi:Glycosyltransferase